MNANEILTVGQFEQGLRGLLARLPTAPATAPVVLYSVDKLAAVLDLHPATVRRWLKHGKPGKAGPQVKLQAYQFTSEPRIPWPAVLAYHRGEDFDLNSLPAPLLAAEQAPYLSLPADVPPLLRVA